MEQHLSSPQKYLSAVIRIQVPFSILLVLGFHDGLCARPTAEAEHASQKSSLSARVMQSGSFITFPNETDFENEPFLATGFSENNGSMDYYGMTGHEQLPGNRDPHNERQLMMSQKAAQRGIRIEAPNHPSTRVLHAESSRYNRNVPVYEIHDHRGIKKGVDELSPEKMKKLQELHDGEGFRGQLANFFHRTIAQEADRLLKVPLQDALEGRVNSMQDHVHDMERQGHASHNAMEEYEKNIQETEQKMMDLDDKLDLLENRRKMHFEKQNKDRMAPFDNDEVAPAHLRIKPRKMQKVPVELHVRGNMSIETPSRQVSPHDSENIVKDDLADRAKLPQRAANIGLAERSNRAERDVDNGLGDLINVSDPFNFGSDPRTNQSSREEIIQDDRIGQRDASDGDGFDFVMPDQAYELPDTNNTAKEEWHHRD
jgi:hypothetical protein